MLPFFSDINELESKADLALVSLAKSQEVANQPTAAAGGSSLRRSQRRIEKEEAAALQSSAGAPALDPFGFNLAQSLGQSMGQTLGLNRSQFVDPFDDMAIDLGASALNSSWNVGGHNLRTSSRLRHSQSVGKEEAAAPPLLTQSQELRHRSLRVSNTLNKTDGLPKTEAAVALEENNVLPSLASCFF